MYVRPIALRAVYKGYVNSSKLAFPFIKFPARSQKLFLHCSSKRKI